MLNQELFETAPIEAMEQFGEELNSKRPELRLFYDVDKNCNPILIARQTIEKQKKEIKICYNISAKQFEITPKGYDYAESTTLDIKTAFFLFESLFFIEPENI
ncbi:MAG: hypothetical protein A2746_02125 [Candidatus Yanofskybacteria bacterium RIFCSPHIGHO2_01_FULL_44_22]|uniref:Uncharacterized protein n=1 Tax=Candidatus Yanofskybacteria bacterium RIFCSPHIGHO2_01_FULL_44_22 TaxID=1802669 RepID=A0A1F8EWU6_9BACT|nr:MAG: hypothetical protein A2746_02125 [Candidatus Yanofskybacteria bacterium RIFCSPHIGHO2_01_FULL_44_22]